MIDSTVAEELLDMGRLTDVEADDYASRAVDPAYWSSLRGDVAAFDVAAAEEIPPDLGQTVDAEGYFVLPSLLPRTAAQRLRALVDSVRAAGWPAVFAYMYDEPWQLYRGEALRRIARATIGPDVAQTRFFWAHYVPPILEGRGWTPHADATLRTDPKRLTIWVALTDATLDNGCMYVIPRHRVDDAALEQFFDQSTAFARDTTLRLLQSSRALPAPAGSVLGWEFRTIHWGSYCHRPGVEPRISLSAEICSASDLRARGEDILPLDAVPHFATRLRYIAAAMKTYIHWDMHLWRYKPVVERLTEQGSR